MPVRRNRHRTEQLCPPLCTIFVGSVAKPYRSITSYGRALRLRFIHSKSAWRTEEDTQSFSARSTCIPPRWHGRARHPALQPWYPSLGSTPGFFLFAAVFEHQLPHYRRFSRHSVEVLSLWRRGSTQVNFPSGARGGRVRDVSRCDDRRVRVVCVPGRGVCACVFCM